jgi:type II secretory pathway component GspD/PulD (secretin)
VTLSVKPEISNHVGDSVFNFAGASVTSPIIDTRTLEANVLIKSGCTLAIGGLLQDEVTRGTTKVPIFGDIPVVGYLFQEHLNSRTKRNLLIFVTPTIISQEFGTGLEDQITGLKNVSLHNEYADPRGWRNNAEGSLRLKKTSEKQIAGDYPAPGDCNTNVSFKETATPKND